MSHSFTTVRLNANKYEQFGAQSADGSCLPLPQEAAATAGPEAKFVHIGGDEVKFDWCVLLVKQHILQTKMYLH